MSITIKHILSTAIEGTLRGSVLLLPAFALVGIGACDVQELPPEENAIIDVSVLSQDPAGYEDLERQDKPLPEGGIFDGTGDSESSAAAVSDRESRGWSAPGRDGVSFEQLPPVGALDNGLGQEIPLGALGPLTSHERADEDELLRISFAGILDVDRFAEEFLLTDQGAQINLGCWPDPDFGDSYLCRPDAPLVQGPNVLVVGVDGVRLEFEFVL